MLTTALDLVGVICLAAFVWFIWPPLVLAVAAGSAIAVSWLLERAK